MINSREINRPTEREDTKPEGKRPKRFDLFDFDGHLEKLGKAMEEKRQSIKENSTVKRMKELLPEDYSLEKVKAAVPLINTLRKIPGVGLVKAVEGVKKANLAPAEMLSMSNIIPELLASGPLNAAKFELLPKEVKARLKDLLMDVLGPKEYIKQVITPLIRRIPMTKLKPILKQIAPLIPESLLRAAAQEALKGLNKEELLEMASKDAGSWFKKQAIKIGGRVLSENSLRQKALDKVNKMGEKELRQAMLVRMESMTEKEMQDIIINNLSDRAARVVRSVLLKD